VKPQLEVLQREDAEQFMQMIGTILPTTSFEIDDSTETYELLGTEEFNGKSCKKIKVTMKETPGMEQMIYTDAMTNWIVGMKIGPMDFILEGMKKVKGFVYPSAIKIVSEGKTAMEFEISKIEADIELEDSLFSK
jgi:hypothetical protein